MSKIANDHKKRKKNKKNKPTTTETENIIHKHLLTRALNIYTRHSVVVRHTPVQYSERPECIEQITPTSSIFCCCSFFSSCPFYNVKTMFWFLTWTKITENSTLFVTNFKKKKTKFIYLIWLEFRCGFFNFCIFFCSVDFLFWHVRWIFVQKCV